MRRILSVAVLAALATSLAAQPSSLTTTYVSNNGQAGNMFDVDASVPVAILRLDIHMDQTVADVEVWAVTGGGSYVGNAGDPSAWTLIDVFPAVSGAGNGVPTPLPPLSTPIQVPAGTLQGIYVTVVNSTAINYTNGSTLGALFATDGTLNVYEGAGKTYPFGFSFEPRVWNGTIHYVTTGPFVPEYQVNQPGASLDFDGVQGTPFSPAVSSTDFCQAVTISTAAAPSAGVFDVGLTVGGSLKSFGGGALRIAGGQLYNVDLLDPGFVWFFGNFTTQFTPQSLSVTLANGTPDLQAQMVVADPTSLTGVWFSQPCEHATTQPSLPPLPPTDDGGLVLDLGALCVLPGGTMTWFGTSFTQVAALANGRLMAGGTIDNDFTVTVPEARADNAFVGYWTDLSPQAVPNGWTLGSPGPDILEISYNGVPYFQQFPPFSSNSFVIRYDAANSSFTLDGLQGIQASFGTAPASFLGISPGNLVGGATDPGAAAFAVGATGSAAAATDMLYEFSIGVAQPAAIAAGVNTLLFTPDGAGNYGWSAL